MARWASSYFNGCDQQNNSHASTANNNNNKEIKTFLHVLDYLRMHILGYNQGVSLLYQVNWNNCFNSGPEPWQTFEMITDISCDSPWASLDMARNEKCAIMLQLVNFTPPGASTQKSILSLSPRKNGIRQQENHLSQTVASTPLNAAKDTVSLLCGKGTLLPHVWLNIHHDAQVFLYEAAYQLGSSQHIQVKSVVPSQMQHSPFIKPISLQFSNKNIVGDCIKSLREVQVDVISSCSPVQWFSYSIIKGH